jgi:two-component system sensor histidine kinase KdpD
MTDNDVDKRPSPEAMLKLAWAEEEEEKKTGRLKIFLGYAAGVGKTYTMLEAARQQKIEGTDVVAAYVESHGRKETDALLEGLEIVPKAHLEYHGVLLPEMDIDAVLARKPQIALVDELAHTNVHGSRHEKRWQDVKELLAAGIDVYTTVNVQHFDSLRDSVAQITEVVVQETVPDRLLDEAAEITLVDIPPEELLQRLREGKVYIPEQAAQAMKKFFRLGNLIALREISMRRAAARIDDQMRDYMEKFSIPGPWPAQERLLVCVSGSPYSERLIRATRRLADELKAPWSTVYIETPGTTKHLRENRQRVWGNLRLAESLGSQVATIAGESVAAVVNDYAVKHNITKIVVGKPLKPRWREILFTPTVDLIIRQSGAIDVFVVSVAPAERKKTAEKSGIKTRLSLSGYGASLALVAAATLACQFLRPFLAPTNMVMIYLLAVVIVALRLGLKPAILTAFLGVLAFDFFFVPPYLTFAVVDAEYIITFVALFAVGVIISSLVSKARDRADALREREAQTASLYYLSRDLAAAADMPSILDKIASNIEEALGAKLAVFLTLGVRLEIKKTSNNLHVSANELAVADWVFHNRQVAGRGTETLSSVDMFYLPMQTSTNTIGVLGIQFADSAEYKSPQSRKLLDALAGQAAVAIERVQFASQAEQAQILQARDNLERALLNSISHDMRTPLVSITGALSALREKGYLFDEESRKELLDAALEEAGRLNRFVGNLLDMTRLEAGVIKLKEELCDVQDLIGCALAALERIIAGRRVDVRLPDNLPLVIMDMVLMTQVVVNLLDNSLKYSPPDKEITISVTVDEYWLTLDISDRGPGIPESDLTKIFDKFYQIPVPEGSGGTGLGLSICKGLVEAHGGKVQAKNRTGGGLTVSVKLPVKPSKDN